MNLGFEPVADVHHTGETARFIDERGVIRGADVEAHRIAALVGGGMRVDEVSKDYPNLTHEQIEAAVQYAATSPKPGRPFPTRTVKAVLRDGGGGGLAAAFAAARDNGNGV